MRGTHPHHHWDLKRQTTVKKKKMFVMNEVDKKMNIEEIDFLKLF